MHLDKQTTKSIAAIDNPSNVNLPPESPETATVTTEVEQIPKTIESASDPWVQKNKLSLLSRPAQVEATIPDFGADEDKLVALGLTKDSDGKWYLAGSNRQWFPNPIDEHSIVINYGGITDEGDPDIGFCSQEEFSRIYADTEQYNNGEIAYIKPAECVKMAPINATKHAVGEFVIVPKGTRVNTNEGVVIAEEGQLLMVNESNNSVYMAPAKKIASRNIGDPMSPASIEVYDQLAAYVAGDIDFSELSAAFSAADRDKKAYEGDDIDNLHESFKQSAELVNKLEAELAPRINSLSFDERASEARAVIDEIIGNSDLSRDEKLHELSYIMARLLPKTNNHQHLKGSVPMETTLALARDHGFSEEELQQIRDSYTKGAAGFENLNEFNDSYGIIGRAVRNPSDYRRAIESIIDEATRSSQMSVEIRCSVIGQRDENGNFLSPEEATENLLSAMDSTTERIGDDAPATSLVFLGYRGRDWKPEEVIEHARLAVEFAKKYPERKFGFDIAGPEDTGYGPMAFKEAYDLIKEYNDAVKRSEIKGELVGVTTHAGETPTFDGGRPGNESVEEALENGADRVGHGVQSVLNATTLNTLKQSGATVEICGVCNITSIPINTRGMAIHPIQEFISRGIPVTICTDNDAICGTSITKEYAQFLFTGHSEMMNWKTVKQVAKQGIESSFISEKDKTRALDLLAARIRVIERIAQEAMEKMDSKRGAGVLYAIEKAVELAA